MEKQYADGFILIMKKTVNYLNEIYLSGIEINGEMKMEEIVKRLVNKIQYPVYTKKELRQQAYLIMLEFPNLTENQIYWKLQYYNNKQNTYNKRYKNFISEDLMG